MLEPPIFYSPTLDRLYAFKPGEIIFTTQTFVHNGMLKHFKAFGRTYYENYLASLAKVQALCPQPETRHLFGMGIEVECESAPNIELPGWSTIMDGSLRNNGREYITCPLEHSAVTCALVGLYNFLLSDQVVQKHKPDFSWRCSIHGHLNVRNWTIEEVFKLILIHTIYEKVLFRFAGMDREKSIFCVPFRESTLMRDMGEFWRGQYSIGSLQAHWEKYSSINLFRMCNYGTVEFRHLSGTPDVTKVVTWFNFLISMAAAAKDISLPELMIIIKDINTTSRFDLLSRRIFKPPLCHLLVAESTKDYEEGVTCCKEIMSETRESVKIDEESAMGIFLHKKGEADKVRPKSGLVYKGFKAGGAGAKKFPKLPIDDELGNLVHANWHIPPLNAAVGVDALKPLVAAHPAPIEHEPGEDHDDFEHHDNDPDNQF
jgi:hypothetical protein